MEALTMASILLIQALFLETGAAGLRVQCVNLGVYTCFIAYPLIYKGLTVKA